MRSCERDTTRESAQVEKSHLFEQVVHPLFSIIQQNSTRGASHHFWAHHDPGQQNWGGKWEGYDSVGMTCWLTCRGILPRHKVLLRGMSCSCGDDASCHTVSCTLGTCDGDGCADTHTSCDELAMLVLPSSSVFAPSKSKMPPLPQPHLPRLKRNCPRLPSNLSTKAPPIRRRQDLDRFLA